MTATSVLPVYSASKQCLQDFINIPLFHYYSRIPFVMRVVRGKLIHSHTACPVWLHKMRTYFSWVKKESDLDIFPPPLPRNTHCGWMHLNPQ